MEVEMRILLVSCKPKSIELLNFGESKKTFTRGEDNINKNTQGGMLSFTSDTVIPYLKL